MPSNIVALASEYGPAGRRESLAVLLRRWARHGAHVGGIGSGTKLLAQAGLLARHRCTARWSDIASIKELQPELSVTAQLFEVDRGRFTCPGGVATLDLMLYEIGDRHGEEFAKSIADQFVHHRIRDGQECLRHGTMVRSGASNPKLIQAVEQMERNIEEALSLKQVADIVGLSVRQLQRLFKQHLRTSPLRYYRKLRIDHAQRLLHQTSMPVTEAAVAVGFSSVSYFASCYRDAFGRSPSADRSCFDRT
ncbi:MAG: helix-turn-helix domain-containing protein [Pseudomonadota bacterium]